MGPFEAQIFSTVFGVAGGVAALGLILRFKLRKKELELRAGDAELGPVEVTGHLSHGQSGFLVQELKAAFGSNVVRVRSSPDFSKGRGRYCDEPSRSIVEKAEKRSRGYG